MAITAPNAGNTFVASPDKVTGGLSYAPLTTELPTSSEVPLGEGVTNGGYLGEDGITKTIDASDENIIAMGGDTVRVVRTEHNLSYTFQFLESQRVEVLKLIKGPENVTVDASGNVVVQETSKLADRMAFIIDTFDGSKKRREVVPNGQITVSGDEVLTHSDIVRYECTITAFPDPTNPGVKAYIYTTGSAGTTEG